MDVGAGAAPIEWWGGPEYTLNRVGDRYTDQTERSGHARRLEDLDRFAGLGLSALRYPVLWERIAPRSIDDPDWRWTDERLPEIRARGMRPIAGLLHHGSGPAYTSLLDPRFPALLARFARMVAERYPWLGDYTPVNEPLTTARFSALYGHWYPHERSNRAFVRALLNQVWGVVLAMREIRAVNPAARLIQTDDCGRCFGTPPTSRQVRFENRRRWLTWDLLAGRVDAAHPLRRYLETCGASARELDGLVDDPVRIDVVGLNYYVTSDRMLDHRVERYPAATHGGNGRMAYADVEAVRARRHGLAGHRAHLLEAWRRYQLPLAITEVHLACTREEQARWLLEAWHAAHGARTDGADVVAITPWALLGSFDWDSLVTQERGHYESGAFDIRGREPRPTAVAAVIRQLAHGEMATHPGLERAGWWRRPERLLYTTALQTRRSGQRRGPLLILGATGTLGRAFQRVAVMRALPACAAGRRDVDITDAAAVHQLVARVRPWAVINAAGYVRVDDAERESGACFDVNTTGAEHVAAACQAIGVPLVTYSTDLVFDGSRDRPYTEDDAPGPLNVYGSSKAAAERRVLDLMPEALVVRTSAFFGPWDRHNFAVRTLEALHRGQAWRAAEDVVVSPTYVPDLVDATLDLLMDRECGIWHLTNEGAMSWFAFAQAVARACGARADLITPAAAAELGWPAPRPAYSALGSVRGRMMRSTEEALTAFAAAVADPLAAAG